MIQLLVYNTSTHTCIQNQQQQQQKCQPTDSHTRIQTFLHINTKKHDIQIDENNSTNGNISSPKKRTPRVKTTHSAEKQEEKEEVVEKEGKRKRE